MILQATAIIRRILSVLILIGALFACSTPPTPFAVPTLTLVPNTETSTPTPITPSPIPDVATSIPLTATPSPSPIVTILETTITPDVDLTRRILRDLANALNIDVERIQIVTIEAAVWFDDQLGCTDQTLLDAQDAIATYRPGVRVDGYRYVLLVGNTAYEYHSEGVRRFESCLSSEHIRDELLLAVDPIALDMLSLVQRIVAEELDLSTRRIQMVSVIPYVWHDTSLGCPQENQSYTQADIPGYRIVVTAGGAEYAYHSDSTTAVLCSAGNETLPD